MPLRESATLYLAAFLTFELPVSNSARDKIHIMESKIMIDINYASRFPQIVIRQKDSEDPRDKLISMLLGESMPGVTDGYCRIERYEDTPDGYVSVITPISPVKMIEHISTIARFAHENAACDTYGVPEAYRKIIVSEYERIFADKSSGASEAIVSPLKAADNWAVENLSTELYKRWSHEIMHPEKI